ncbi:DUF4276 family protein [Neolewinella sp.]|uniref:DUF4276 family protein n=1 Tax=Neolewinella sp. TaxID=2993543 RepID=UPI003B51B423
MIQLIVICEGESERGFCQLVLAPYLLPLGIYLRPPLIKKSGGGMVHWLVLQRQLEMHLKQEKQAYITTFIDLYGIKARHKVPGFTKIGSTNSLNRVLAMERGMKEAIPQEMRYRFLPYIQLHDFEALLFSDVTVFHDTFSEADFADATELDRIATAYQNPEDINDSKVTAPSKRLERILPGYDKALDGPILAQEIGMERLLERCPHFRGWVEGLRNILEEE